jgi:hypothetical protein
MAVRNAGDDGAGGKGKGIKRPVQQKIEILFLIGRIENHHSDGAVRILGGGEFYNASVKF